jgi:hypothetical protein
MCWNAEVSFQSFGIGLIGIIVASNTGFSPSMLIFFATIVFMQLIEGMVWTYGSNPDINFYASLSAAALLMIQPIASIMAIAPTLYKIPMMIAYIVMGLITHLIEHKTDPRSLREQYRMETQASPEQPKSASRQSRLYPSTDRLHKENPLDRDSIDRGVWGRLRLHWKWLDPIPWASLAIYFIFLIGPLILTKQYDFVALVLATLAISVYSFGKGWGSMWCWIVNLMVIVICAKKLL